MSLAPHELRAIARTVVRLRRTIRAIADVDIALAEQRVAAELRLLTRRGHLDFTSATDRALLFEVTVAVGRELDRAVQAERAEGA